MKSVRPIWVWLPPVDQHQDRLAPGDAVTVRITETLAVLVEKP